MYNARQCLQSHDWQCCHIALVILETVTWIHVDPTRLFLCLSDTISILQRDQGWFCLVGLGPQRQREPRATTQYLSHIYIYIYILHILQLLYCMSYMSYYVVVPVCLSVCLTYRFNDIYIDLNCIQITDINCKHCHACMLTLQS